MRRRHAGRITDRRDDRTRSRPAARAGPASSPCGSRAEPSACAAAVAVILVVGLVPLPTVAIQPPSVEVEPQPADEVRVCAGAILRLGDETGQDAGTGVALGDPSVRSAAVGGTLRPGVLEATDAGTGGTSAAPAVFQLTPEPGATLAAAQSQVVDDEGFSGYAATACAEPSGSVWLVGGATTIGRTTLLTLANPTEVDATVSLSIFGENGAVTAPGMSGIHVAAGSQRVLSLAGFAPELLSPVVHVESRGGRVAAWLQQSITRILDPGGVELDRRVRGARRPAGGARGADPRRRRREPHARPRGLRRPRPGGAARRSRRGRRDGDRERRARGSRALRAPRSRSRWTRAPSSTSRSTPEWRPRAEGSRSPTACTR